MPQSDNQNTLKLLQEQTLLLSEVMVKLSALETLLINKGVISSEEFSAEIKEVVGKLSAAFEANLNKENN